MAEIPGWAYIAIGAIVSGFSKFVQVRSGKVMTFFIYIGFAFIAVGVGKLAFAALFKKSRQGQAANRKVHSQSRQGHQAQFQQQGRQQARQQSGQQFPQHATQHHLHQVQQQRQAYANASPGAPNLNTQHTQSHHVKQVHPQGRLEHPSVISCPGCGIQHYSYANFCMMCGAVMRRK